jgi:L-rhamnose mutarotase
MAEGESGKRYGSLIRLKPEYEERYIILHRHTFPGVLRRIRKSNIRNYSIFLYEGMLFSFYEYTGADYPGDMGKIGADAVTRDWWKLTDPMQSPLETRAEGEWWAGMPELLHLEEVGRSMIEPPQGASRFAYVAEARIPSPSSGQGLRDIFQDIGVQALSLYAKDDRLYAYLEYKKGDELNKQKEAGEVGLARFLKSIGPMRSRSEWRLMREVFHTD